MIALMIYVALIVGVICFILGGQMHYRRGYDDAVADCEAIIQDMIEEDEADDIADIRWELTASARSSMESAVLANSHAAR